MRERYPSSGYGFLIVILIVIAATVLVMNKLVTKYPQLLG